MNEEGLEVALVALNLAAHEASHIRRRPANMDGRTALTETAQLAALGQASRHVSRHFNGSYGESIKASFVWPDGGRPLKMP